MLTLRAFHPTTLTVREHCVILLIPQGSCLVTVYNSAARPSPMSSQNADDTHEHDRLTVTGIDSVYRWLSHRIRHVQSGLSLVLQTSFTACLWIQPTPTLSCLPYYYCSMVPVLWGEMCTARLFSLCTEILPGQPINHSSHQKTCATRWWKPHPSAFPRFEGTHIGYQKWSAYGTPESPKIGFIYPNLSFDGEMLTKNDQTSATKFLYVKNSSDKVVVPI